MPVLKIELWATMYHYLYQTRFGILDLMELAELASLWHQMSKEAFPICMDGYVPIMSNGTKDLNQEEKCPPIRATKVI